MLDDIWTALKNAYELTEEEKIQAIRNEYSDEYQFRLQNILSKIGDLQEYVARTLDYK